MGLIWVKSTTKTETKKNTAILSAVEGNKRGRGGWTCLSLKRQSRVYGLSILRLCLFEYLTICCDYIRVVFGFYGQVTVVMLLH